VLRSIGSGVVDVRESRTIREGREADALEDEPPTRRDGGVEQAAAALIPDPSAPDRPAHEWRGLMLDSARTCWGVEVVHELLELMARYRLNRLHWHLTDASGWRFEVPGRPRLTSVGAHLPRPDYSGYGNVLPAKREAADERAAEVRFNGSYGAEDIAAVVEHARGLGIEVMPEVDLPGHMAAAIRSHPELGDPRLVDVDPADWPHANDLLWPGEESFGFVAKVLEAVMDLFPSSLAHIGGDECKHRVWESDPELVRRYGDDPGSGRGGLGARLQGMFTDHARAVLGRRGRRPAAWDELLETPASGEEVILAWRGAGGVPLAEGSGHDWVYADCTRLYLNRVAGDPATEPPGMFGPIGARDIIELPVPDSSRLLGIHAAVWSEFILDREHLLHQLFPRLLAVAERAWVGPGVEWRELSARLEAETAWLRANGVPASLGQPAAEHLP
jgi:hexosaminidase